MFLLLENVSDEERLLASNLIKAFLEATGCSEEEYHKLITYQRDNSLSNLSVDLNLIIHTNIQQVQFHFPETLFLLKCISLLDIKIPNKLFCQIVQEIFTSKLSAVAHLTNELIIYGLLQQNEDQGEVCIDPVLKKSLFNGLSANEIRIYINLMLYVINSFLLENSQDQLPIIKQIELLIEFVKRQVDDYSNCLIVTYFNLGVVYQTNNNTQKAIGYQTRALEIYKNKYKVNTKNTQYVFPEEVLPLLSNMAVNYYSLGRVRQSKECYELIYVTLSRTRNKKDPYLLDLKRKVEALNQECVYRSIPYQVYSYGYRPLKTLIYIGRNFSLSGVSRVVFDYTAVPTVGWVGNKTGYFSREKGEYWTSWVTSGVSLVLDPLGYATNKTISWTLNQVSNFTVKLVGIKNETVQALVKIASNEVADYGSKKICQFYNKNIEEFKKDHKRIQAGDKVTYHFGSIVIKDDRGKEVGILKERITPDGVKIITLESGIEIITYPEGSDIIKQVTSPTGEQRIKFQDGTISTTRNVGEKIVETPSGTKIYKNPTGIVAVEQDVKKDYLLFPPFVENPLDKPNGWQVLTLPSGEEALKSPTNILFLINGEMERTSNTKIMEYVTKTGEKISIDSPGWKPLVTEQKVRISQMPSVPANQNLSIVNRLGISKDEEVIYRSVKIVTLILIHQLKEHCELYIKYIELEKLRIKLETQKELLAINNEKKLNEQRHKMEQKTLDQEFEIENIQSQIRIKKHEIDICEKSIKQNLIEEINQIVKHEVNNSLEKIEQFLQYQIQSIQKLNYYVPFGSYKLIKIIQEIINTLPYDIQIKLNEFLENIDLLIEHQITLEKQLDALNEALIMLNASNENLRRNTMVLIEEVKDDASNTPNTNQQTTSITESTNHSSDNNNNQNTSTIQSRHGQLNPEITISNDPNQTLQVGFIAAANMMGSIVDARNAQVSLEQTRLEQQGLRVQARVDLVRQRNQLEHERHEHAQDREVRRLEIETEAEIERQKLNNVGREIDNKHEEFLEDAKIRQLKLEMDKKEELLKQQLEAMQEKNKQLTEENLQLKKTTEEVIELKAENALLKSEKQSMPKAMELAKKELELKLKEEHAPVKLENEQLKLEKIQLEKDLKKAIDKILKYKNKQSTTGTGQYLYPQPILAQAVTQYPLNTSNMHNSQAAQYGHVIAPYLPNSPQQQQQAFSTNVANDMQSTSVIQNKPT